MVTEAPVRAVNPAPAGRARRLGWAVTLVVVVATVLVRWQLIRGGAGLYSISNYDDGVYQAAADALVHGRWPYRDFVFLHPPGITLVLAPFAWWGRMTSDPTGWAAARVAFLALAGLNAGIVSRLARPLGLLPALVGGGVYAVWHAGAYSDHSTFLEPVGSTMLLVALLLLRGEGDGARGGWRPWAAGAALGAGAAVKIWGVVPLAVALVAVAVAAGRREALRLLAGAALAATAVCLPFLVAARGSMWRMVVIDQLTRAHAGGGPLQRLVSLTDTGAHLSARPVALQDAVALAIGVAAVVAAVLAWRQPAARLWAALLAVHAVVLLVSPSYFLHYAEFMAPPLALTAAAAAATLGGYRPGLRETGRVPAVGGPRSGRRPSASAVAGTLTVAVLAVIGVGSSRMTVGWTFPSTAANRVLPQAGCVVADAPSGLIAADRLSSSLEHGCPVAIDVTGATYDDRYARASEPGGGPMPRVANLRWQQYISAYLTSGVATVLVRPVGTDLSAATRRRLGRLPVLLRGRGFRILGR